MPKKNRICVLGGGIWGSVMADILAAESGNSVRIWEFDRKRASFLDNKRRHPDLPELGINRRIEITDFLPKACEGSELIIVAFPSKHVKTVFGKLRGSINGNTRVVSLSKGMDPKTLSTPAQTITAMFPRASKRIFALSGPSFAAEVAKKVPTKLILAGRNRPELARTARFFNRCHLHVETTLDLKGVEMSGALKNVYAIGSGIIKGLRNTGGNTKAAYLSMALNEMKEIISSAGGKTETLLGHAAAGDLILTGTSELSRNFRLGVLIGRGEKPEKALEKIKTTAEGYVSVLSARKLSRKLKIKAPLIETLWRVIYKGEKAEKILDAMGFILG